MSHQAVTWALRQPVSHSPAKFVLAVLAHHVKADASRPWRAFASVTLLVQQTGQDRKTVLANLKRLVDLGCLVDSGEREGGTGRVVVWHLREPANSPETGTVKQSQKRDHSIVPNSAPLNSTETGTIAANSAGNSPETGTVNAGNGPNSGTSGKPEIVPVFPTEKDLYKEVIPLSVGTTGEKSKSEVQTAPKRRSPDPSRGSRLPDDWVLPRSWGEEALALRTDLDRDAVRRLADGFRDYWIAQPGAKGRKANWLATWRNWVRKDAEFGRPGRNSGSSAADPWSTAV